MVADTYSNTLGFLIQGTGNNNNTWGSLANTLTFQILEDAIANALTSAVAGGTLDLSGSPPPAAASQTRYSTLIFTGALASNQIVIVPNLRKFWYVKNSTTTPGASTLTIKTTAGTAVAVPQFPNDWVLVSCDGSNTITVQIISIPRLTSTQQGNIPAAALSAGLIIFNTTTVKLRYWTGAAWADV